MRSETEIESEMLALQRPSMAASDCGNLRALSELRRRQLDWSTEYPAKALRWLQLLEEANANEQVAGLERKRQAELVRASAAVRRIVGDRIADVLAKPSQTHAMGAAREWGQSRLWCLALLGGVGSGKSVAAGWLAHQALSRSDGVCWLRASEAATGSLYGPEAQQRAQWARSARLLVIDDFGAEMASEAWKSWLEDVLGARYANAGRTVVTTNLDAEAFRARLGLRLTDRIREGMVVGTAAVSMRTRGGA